MCADKVIDTYFLLYIFFSVMRTQVSTHNQWISYPDNTIKLSEYKQTDYIPTIFLCGDVIADVFKMLSSSINFRLVVAYGLVGS